MAASRDGAKDDGMARRQPENKKNDGSEGFGWKPFLSHLSSFVIVALFAVVLVAAAFGMRPLRERSAGHIGDVPVKVSFAWPRTMTAAGGLSDETWLPAANQEELVALALGELGDDPDPFSSVPLERIGTTLAATGWFSAPPLVFRASGSSIIVRGDWRIPAAVVRADRKDYLIAWDGRMMPPIYEVGECKLRAIIGPACPPPAKAGGARDFETAWPGEDIAASLELLALIADKKWVRQIEGVDASAYSEHTNLTLLTKDGSRIVWGGRPSKPRLGDVNTRQKLANIAELVRQFGRPDAGYARVDVSRDKLLFDISASATAVPTAAANPASVP